MNPAYQNVRFRADLPKAGVPSRFAIITAWNPDGQDVSAEENTIATERLRSDLLEDGHFFFPVTGGSPDFSHAEPGFGVLLKSAEEIQHVMDTLMINLSPIRYGQETVALPGPETLPKEGEGE